MKCLVDLRLIIDITVATSQNVGTSRAGTAGQTDPPEEVGLDRPYAEETTSQHNKTGPELESPGEAKERPTLQQLEA